MIFRWPLRPICLLFKLFELFENKIGNISCIFVFIKHAAFNTYIERLNEWRKNYNTLSDIWWFFIQANKIVSLCFFFHLNNIWTSFFFSEFQSYFSEFREDFGAAGILLWAIFLNRKDLAEICWRNVKNRLCKKW